MRLHKYPPLFLVIGCLMLLIISCATDNSLKMGSYTRIDNVFTREKVIDRVLTGEKITVPIEIHEPINLQTAKGIILMIPGGDGHISGGSFTDIAADKFAEQGYVVGHMAVPSDMWSMPLEFRWSYDHQWDIKKTVDYLRGKYQQKPLYLLGHSNGTISLRNYHLFHNDISDIAGMILMGGGWKWHLDNNDIDNFINIPYQLLQVFHENDCYYGRQCEYSSVVRYHDILQAKDRKGLITVQGGSEKAEGLLSNEKTLGYHRFVGKEDKVVKAVVEWIDGTNGMDAKEVKRIIN